MPNLKFLKRTFLCAMLFISGALVTSCFRDVPEENRFTWTGELISTYLEKEEDYSKFVTILKKANLSKKAESSIFQTLSTYGSYTCFTPTNDAIDAFLEEMVANPESGITSTDIEVLDDSIATEIAKNHIIEKAFKTSDTPDGEFSKWSMNRRPISMDTKSGAIMINTTSKIVKLDIETENGVIQVIDKVINPSTKKLHEQILQYPEFSLFGQAILATGLDSLLDIYEIAPNYEGNVKADKEVDGQGAAFSPAELLQRYTVLIESNELLATPENNHLNIPILTLEDLETLAKEFYGNKSPGKYTDPSNALYQYILYHIVDRQLSYTGGPGGFIMENYTASGGIPGTYSSEDNLPTTFDRYDYFETMLPYSTIKVTKPYTNKEYANDIVLNYAQEGGTKVVDQKMAKYLNVVVQRKEDSGIENFVQQAINGYIHTINKILIYDENEMAGNVLNERMRWDTASLFPEWTNNAVRWEAPGHVGETKVTTTYIPEGYSKRLVINGVPQNTVMIYLRPTKTGLNGYTNYFGDELLAVGRYDFEYRIPYVPSGNYEIRFGYCVSPNRAITQFYFDDKVCGIPVDLKIDGDDPLIGWESDESKTEDEIRELDKTMRNHGYMKGPASVVLEANDNKNMRASNRALRKIVGQFNITRGDHWLRFKNVTDGGGNPEFNQDYLEIVPVGIIKNQSNPEDQY